MNTYSLDMLGFGVFCAIVLLDLALMGFKPNLFARIGIPISVVRGQVSSISSATWVLSEYLRSTEKSGYKIGIANDYLWFYQKAKSRSFLYTKGYIRIIGTEIRCVLHQRYASIAGCLFLVVYLPIILLLRGADTIAKVALPLVDLLIIVLVFLSARSFHRKMTTLIGTINSFTKGVSNDPHWQEAFNQVRLDPTDRMGSIELDSLLRLIEIAHPKKMAALAKDSQFVALKKQFDSADLDNKEEAEDKLVEYLRLYLS